MGPPLETPLSFIDSARGDTPTIYRPCYRNEEPLTRNTTSTAHTANIVPIHLKFKEVADLVRNANVNTNTGEVWENVSMIVVYPPNTNIC